MQSKILLKKKIHIGIKGLPGKILWDRNEFPKAFRLIFDRAKAELTAQAEPPKQPNNKNNNVVKNLFNKKQAQPQLRLEAIKDLIRKESKNTSKSKNVS